jgi:hypothetical protein
MLLGTVLGCVYVCLLAVPIANVSDALTTDRLLKARVEKARAQCKADTDSIVEDARIVAYDGLRVECAPPRHSPPCVAEAFFHTPSKGGLNWLSHGGASDYGVCKQRPHYSDWPIVDPHIAAERQPGDGFTKRPADISALLGPTRRIGIFGASTARQLHAAALCQLASSGLNFSALQQQWSMVGVNRVNEMLRCERGPNFASCKANVTLLASHFEPFDVVITGFDPQHYGGTNIQLELWEKDSELLTAALGHWAALDQRKAAFVRDGSAFHFVGAELQKAPRFTPATFNANAQKASCRCEQKRGTQFSSTNRHWRANLALNAALGKYPVLHPIPFYNATSERADMHKADMCSYRHPLVDGVPTPKSRRRAAAHPIRMCCDCLHLCYSPAFYDSVFFTPIWHALAERHGYSDSPAARN